MKDMTLLDYFAAKALPCVLGAKSYELVGIREVAAVAYHIADAMMEEKARQAAEINEDKE